MACSTVPGRRRTFQDLWSVLSNLLQEEFIYILNSAIHHYVPFVVRPSSAQHGACQLTHWLFSKWQQPPRRQRGMPASTRRSTGLPGPARKSRHLLSACCCWAVETYSPHGGQMASPLDSPPGSLHSEQSPGNSLKGVVLAAKKQNKEHLDACPLFQKKHRLQILFP